MTERDKRLAAAAFVYVDTKIRKGLAVEMAVDDRVKANLFWPYQVREAFRDGAAWTQEIRGASPLEQSYVAFLAGVTWAREHLAEEAKEATNGNS